MKGSHNSGIMRCSGSDGSHTLQMKGSHNYAKADAAYDCGSHTLQMKGSYNESNSDGSAPAGSHILQMRGSHNMLWRMSARTAEPDHILLNRGVAETSGIPWPFLSLDVILPSRRVAIISPPSGLILNAPEQKIFPCRPCSLISISI